MNFLRQSTAGQSRSIGPFLDDGDYITPLTGLTIANTDIKLILDGGAAVDKNSGGGTHRANGIYGVTFDATDTATVGELQVSVAISGALPFFQKFRVITQAAYDALFGSSANLSDAVLVRSVAEVEDIAAEDSLAMVVLATKKNSLLDNPGFITIYKSDGSEFAQFPVVTNPSAEGIVEIG